MNAQIVLKDQDNKEVINVENIKSKNSIMYKDTDNAFNVLTIFENGIRIKRIDDDHSTLVYLNKNDDSYVEISTPDGDFKIGVKVLEFLNNNDIISIAYKIEEQIKNIDISFTGAKNDN